jgi:hypothetical protein
MDTDPAIVHVISSPAGLLTLCWSAAMCVFAVAVGTGLGVYKGIHDVLRMQFSSR